MQPLKPITLTLAQHQQERIVLDSFVQPGDEVIVARRPDFGRDGYERDLPPDGTRAWAVGHSTWFNFVGRKGVYRNRPGVYRRYGHAVYQYFDAEGTQRFGHLDPHQLIFANPADGERKGIHHSPIRSMYDYGVRVGDLPETPVVEGDIVKVSGKVGTIFKDYDYIARIDGIEYGWNAIMDQCDPAGLAYRLTPLMGGFTTTASVSEIELVERGNYYWFEHDQSQLKFEDLKEKARFYQSVGLSEELRNPATDNFAWSLEEVLDYLSQGMGAGFISHPNPFQPFNDPTPSQLHLYDFPSMPELAKEVREATLQGFGRTVSA